MSVPVAVPAAPPAAVPLPDLAVAARSALGADAAAIVELAGTGAAVLGTTGLAAAEVERLVARVLAAPRRAMAVPGFPTVLIEDLALDDGPRVALCALRRESWPFEDPWLAAAFARHAAVSIAGARGRAGADAEWSAPPPAKLSLLAGRLLDGLAYEDLTAAVGEQLAIAIGPTRVGIHVWDEQLGTLQMAPGSFGAEPEIAGSGRSSPVDWESCAARVYATGHSYITNAVSEDPGVLQDAAAAIGLRRLLVVPLDAGGRRVGVLQVADKADPFTVADLHAAEDLAPGIALVVASTRMRSGLLRLQRIEEILSRVAIAIASGKSLQDFLGAALDDLCGALNAAVLAVVPVSGEPTLWRRRTDRPELERILVAEAREADGLRAYVVPPRRVGDPGWAAVHLPVHVNGVRVATLALLRHEGRGVDADDRRALSRLANLVALAWATERYQLERAALARQAERQRIADELHDHTAQLLFAARLRLDAALDDPSRPETAAACTERARSLVVRADEAVREIVSDLADRGRADGLEDLLVAVVTAVEDEFGRPVQLEIAPAVAAAAGRLGRPAADLLAKVAREALVNAAKHAGPCQLALRVALTRRDRLGLSVADDGIGGPGCRREGHGIASLRRAVRRHGGVLRVRVARTGGTTVTVSLPL